MPKVSIPKSLPLCMNCAHFAIAHDDANLYHSADATPQQRADFVTKVIISHGVCQLSTVVNLVTGITEHPRAEDERKFGKCGLEAINFQEITPDQEHPPIQ